MITQKHIMIVIVAALIHACKTVSPGNASKTIGDKSLDSVVDSDGNKYLVKLFSDDLAWMTSNLNVNIPGSYCYNDSKENCQHYGRLYTWESAKKGCLLLGNGWRLPTNDEWKGLVEVYGGVVKDSNEMRKQAYKVLMYPGDSKFNAVLGGGRDFEGKYSRLEAHGFYWTATENDTTTAWFYNFGKGSQALFQQDGGEKSRAFSVRCVKSVDSLRRGR